MTNEELRERATAAFEDTLEKNEMGWSDEELAKARQPGDMHDLLIGIMEVFIADPENGITQLLGAIDCMK